MLLDCSCPWNGNLIMVSWTKGNHIHPLAVYHPEYGVNFNPDYDGRVEFINASSMDGSIRIMNITEEDQGLYHCSMQTFPHGSWTKDTLVQKKGITVEQPVFLTVFFFTFVYLVVKFFSTVQLFLIIKCHQGFIYYFSVLQL